jgi:hypothetical protein
VLNKLLGACVGWILALPLIILQTGLSFFLFVDKLLEGEYWEAFKTLLLSPFKALATFFILSMLASSLGWEHGFGALFYCSWTGVSSFFNHVFMTEAAFFFAVMFPDMVGWFEGAYVGHALNKLTLLLMSNQVFEDYEHQDSMEIMPGESTGQIQAMLDEKLTQRYHAEYHTQSALVDCFGLSSTDVKERMQAQRTQEGFLAENKRVIGYYPRFLNETPQGRRLTQRDVVKQEKLDSMIDATLDAWSPPNPC